MRDMLVLNGYPQTRIVVSPYGVHSPSVDFRRVTSHKLRFGFIGRLTSIKGVHLLLKAFKQVSQQGKAQLTIYGKADAKADGYMRILQRLAAKSLNINFAGFVDNNSISDIYRHLDVLVVPSIWPENSPITILEALAHGIPIIASDAKGIADLVQHDVNGLIFANQDSRDLARQMSRCLDSPELVDKLAANCRMIKSLAEDADNIIKLYKQLLAAKSSV
jgi:glycosyltransferase involved in cell wall biosynthesis